jgi:hypothetical protein
MMSLLNFIKIYQLVEKLIRETDTQAGRSSHKPTFSFRKEIMLKAQQSKFHVDNLADTVNNAD